MYRLGVFGDKMYELVELNAGQYYPPHIHKSSEANLMFVFGSGKVFLDGEGRNYKKGDKVFVGKGMSHGFEVFEQTLFLSVQNPPIIDPKTGKIDIEYLNK